MIREDIDELRALVEQTLGVNAGGYPVGEPVRRTPAPPLIMRPVPPLQRQLHPRSRQRFQHAPKRRP